METKHLNIPKYTTINKSILEGENMAATTIKLEEETKFGLDTFREYKNESYDEIVRKLLYVAKTTKTDPQLSRKTVEEIEAARKRIKEGKFYTEVEMKKLLGL